MNSFFRVLLIALLASTSYSALAAAGDTLKVQTFTFGSKQDSTFAFPPDTFNCAKVLMYYTLKCPSGGCGQWDYLTYTYLYKPTGKIDSQQVRSPFFIENGQAPDSFSFMKKPSWSYTFNSTTYAVDSTVNPVINILFYRDNKNPNKVTDTIKGYLWTFRIQYNTILKKADTTYYAADTIIRQKYFSYYQKYPDNIRYELARYITPYGIGLSLGNGFTWVYDVSDYRHLLHDSVHLSAGNWQELLNMQFVFIKGTPARDIKSIQNLWNGQPAYGTSTSIEKFLHPLTVKLSPNDAEWRVKMRTTGHGFGGTDDCAEFCPRLHSIDVDGVTRFADTMFRYDCALNPVSAQGPTWVFSRSNWCPGSSVKTYNYELTPYVKPGDSVTLDYNIQPYTWNGVGTTPYYSIETQLVSYGPPNFHTNAAMEDIIAPSNADIYKRLNPACTMPTILIKNNGADTLTSLDITYGVKDTSQFTYHWTGKLAFLDTQRVILGGMNWGAKSHEFSVMLSNPNGKTDEYPADNTMSTYFTPAPSMASQFIIELQTNKVGSDNSYTLKNAFGAIILNKNNLANNKLYRDTVKLVPGCYILDLEDASGDGLNWWNNPAAGVGYFDLRGTNHRIIKTFNPDFGSEVYYQFTVGSYADGIEPVANMQPAINLYPNPNNGRFTLSLSLPDYEKVEISVMDAMGRIIYNTSKSLASGELPLELPAVARGCYIVRIFTPQGIFYRKMMVN